MIFRPLLGAIGVAVAAAALLGAAPVSSPEMKAYMKSVVNPAGDAVFAAGNDAPAGETPAQAAARFDAGAKGAAVLKAAAVRLASPEFAPKGDGGDWAKFSAKLGEVATAAEAAAKAKNVDAAFAAGGDLYEACNSCHHEYQAGRS